jgi:hypothetical protein
VRQRAARGLAEGFAHCATKPCISTHPCYMLCCLLNLSSREMALIPGPNA